MRILEEFWYGNIEPTEYDTISCKEYKEVIRLITRNEEKLLSTMTDEQKELFSRYTDAVQEYRYKNRHPSPICTRFEHHFHVLKPHLHRRSFSDTLPENQRH